MTVKIIVSSSNDEVTNINAIKTLVQIANATNAVEFESKDNVVEPELINDSDSIKGYIDIVKYISTNLASSTPALESKMDKMDISKDETTSASATTPPEAASVDGVPTQDELNNNPIVQKLKELDIEYQVYGHVVCNTAEELVTNVKLPSSKETHTKNLLFKDKKHGMFLLTLHPETQVNTKILGSDLLKLQGKVNLRFASADILMDKLQCKPGTIGPLSIINDTNKEITLILDSKLVSQSDDENNYNYIHSHPLRNDASVILKPNDLIKYLTKIQHMDNTLIIDFNQGQDGNEKPTEILAGKVPSNRPPESKKPKQSSQQPKKGGTSGGSSKQSSQKQVSTGAQKGDTLLALQWKKEENFPQWYSDVIVLSEMISYYDISGCYILRPWSYEIWEHIQNYINIRIKSLGVSNTYFPLFVSKDRLEKEKDHVEGFSPEVAWVTKSGDDELSKPIAIRPTSETVMYPSFSNWITSHRDLPLKLNQWANVVRWEFKDPTPFLRTREFLWQEGHTAHSSYDETQVMVRNALDMYKDVYEDLLAVPVIPGYKTEKEKFAGGYSTTTVEAYIPISGRAIQGATSHNLGQNFGKMFDITYQNTKGESEVVWQSSWGLTTRTIGVMIMVHGDDKGLVLPPKVAPIQVVIVPIVSKTLSLDKCSTYCNTIKSNLESANIRVKYDDRDMYNPGWKYNHWEQKGVPIRIEVGPRDIENNSLRIVIRYNNEKYDIPNDESNMPLTIQDKLNDIHDAMYNKALKVRDDHLVQVTKWDDFVPNLEKHNLVLTPWCGGKYQEEEEIVKNKSRQESLEREGQTEPEDERTATSVAAKTLCIPFNQPELPVGTKCFATGKDATCWVLWGRSY